ncbi:MAG TPA: hypothetical protein VHX86_19310 [Tepidisphaeraceae bacterium]|jgi:hypothetical protein|nr:hypothetical protein [Tepidisphaeraceae bacterium]
MILAALLIILLPQQGYWFGGEPQEVTVRWPTQGKMPPVDFSWNLMVGNIRLTGGTLPIRSDADATTFKITPPKVRTRTTASIIYRVRQHEGGKELGGGDLSVQLFPRDMLSGLVRRLNGKRLAVWDSSGLLSHVLKSAKVAFVDTKDGSGLVLTRYDIVLVGGDVLGTSLFAQQPLLDQARAGASVMVFAQQKSSVDLFGYALDDRKMPSRLNWRMDHPLFAGFERADLESWLHDSPDALALRLPADEPALEIAWWPREVPGTEPVPLDALVISKSIGAGRIVLCQLPLGDWSTDPRSQLLLSNAIDYLLTRPEPTLRPSERPATQPAAIMRDPNRITLPGE